MVEVLLIPVCLLFVLTVIVNWRVGRLERLTDRNFLAERVRLSKQRSDVLQLLDTLALQDITLDQNNQKLRTELADLRSQLKTWGAL